MTEYEINEKQVEEIKKLLSITNVFTGVTLYYNNKAITASTIENNVHPEKFLEYYNAKMITITFEVGSVLYQIYNGQSTGITEDGCDDFDWKIQSVLNDIAEKYNRQLDVYTEGSILFTPKVEFGSYRDISIYQTELGKQKSEVRYGLDEEMEKIISKVYK